MQTSGKRLETEAWKQSTTKRKWPMVDRKMTSLMTLRDPESQGHDPKIFKARYFENGSSYRFGYNGAPKGNGKCGIK